MDEIRPGLWTWTAEHPDWTPEAQGWDRVVRSYAYDSGDCLVLFDPLAPPALVDEIAAGKTVAVLLTVRWHERSAGELAGRLGASVFTGEQSLDRTETKATAYRPGDTLPGGAEVRETADPEEAVFWVPAHGAVVAGDVLLGGKLGLHVQPDSWLAESVTPEGLRASLRPLLELPLELILLTHGDPVVQDARGALARALET